MRLLMIALAAAGISACDRNSHSERSEMAATPAAVTYDGATATDRSAVVAHGERLSFILGCKACHGDDLRGNNVTKDDPSMGQWWAPNITLLLAKYDDAALGRLIRHGVPHDGRTMYFMPFESLQFLSDADLAAVIAYLRTLRPGGEQTPAVKKGPLYIELEQKGEFAAAPEMIRRFKADQPVDLGPEHRLGRYIAMTVCSECHNASLQGFEGFSPSLDTAGAYDIAELERLLTTGEGKVKKELVLMSATSRLRFAKFTPRERAAIVAYLKARAERPR
ncbi:MAG: c-type cytochrome [Sphingomicrobium sp.]